MGEKEFDIDSDDESDTSWRNKVFESVRTEL